MLYHSWLLDEIVILYQSAASLNFTGVAMQGQRYKMGAIWNGGATASDGDA